MLINSVNMAIDKIFVARGAGILALSGVTVSLGVYLVLQGFSLLLAAGSASAIALGLGKDDKKGAEKIVGSSVTLSFVLSLLLTVIGLPAARPMMIMYGANAENIRYAMEYSTVLIAGSVFFLLAQTANSIIKGMGYAKELLLTYSSVSLSIRFWMRYLFLYLGGACSVPLFPR